MHKKKKKLFEKALWSVFYRIEVYNIQQRRKKKKRDRSLAAIYERKAKLGRIVQQVYGWGLYMHIYEAGLRN